MGIADGPYDNLAALDADIVTAITSITEAGGITKTEVGQLLSNIGETHFALAGISPVDPIEFGGVYGDLSGDTAQRSTNVDAIYYAINASLDRINDPDGGKFGAWIRISGYYEIDEPIMPCWFSDPTSRSIDPDVAYTIPFRLSGINAHTSIIAQFGTGQAAFYHLLPADDPSHIYPYGYASGGQAGNRISPGDLSSLWCSEVHVDNIRLTSESGHGLHIRGGTSSSPVHIHNVVTCTGSASHCGMYVTACYQGVFDFVVADDCQNQGISIAGNGCTGTLFTQQNGGDGFTLGGSGNEFFVLSQHNNGEQVVLGGKHNRIFGYQENPYRIENDPRPVETLTSDPAGAVDDTKYYYLDYSSAGNFTLPADDSGFSGNNWIKVQNISNYNVTITPTSYSATIEPNDIMAIEYDSVDGWRMIAINQANSYFSFSSGVKMYGVDAWTNIAQGEGFDRKTYYDEAWHVLANHTTPDGLQKLTLADFCEHLDGTSKSNSYGKFRWDSHTATSMTWSQNESEAANVGDINVTTRKVVTPATTDYPRPYPFFRIELPQDWMTGSDAQYFRLWPFMPEYLGNWGDIGWRTGDVVKIHMTVVYDDEMMTWIRNHYPITPHKKREQTVEDGEAFRCIWNPTVSFLDEPLMNTNTYYICFPHNKIMNYTMTFQAASDLSTGSGLGIYIKQHGGNITHGAMGWNFTKFDYTILRAEY